MANPVKGFDPHGTGYELWPGVCATPETPIVLVHGVGLDRHMWDWMLPALTARHSVLRYDLLGHGVTPHRARTSKVADFVAQLTQLVEHLGCGPLHLVGYSLGALVSQLYAARRAESLRSVTFMNGVYRRRPEELAAVRERLRLTREHGAASTVDMAVERWFTPRFVSARPEVIAWVRGRLLANDLRGYVAAYGCFVHGDGEIGDALTRVHCPALAVTADGDVGSTPEMSRRMAADLADGRVEVLEGLRHGAPIEAPERMNEVLGEFLLSVERRPLQARSR